MGAVVTHRRSRLRPSRPVAAGDVVWITYDNLRGTTVGIRLTEHDAAAVNDHDPPFVIPQVNTPVVAVQLPRTAVHWCTPCSGRPFVATYPLARSLDAVTCRRCLMRRARDLAGWRWTHPSNADDVAYLKRILGTRVERFGERPAIPY